MCSGDSHSKPGVPLSGLSYSLASGWGSPKFGLTAQHPMRLSHALTVLETYQHSPFCQVRKCVNCVLKWINIHLFAKSENVSTVSWNESTFTLLPSQKMCQLSWNFQHSLSAKLENVSTVSLEYMIVTTRAMHVILPMHKTILQIEKKIATSIWCSTGKSGAGVNVTHLAKLTCSNLSGISLIQLLQLCGI